MNLLFDLRGMFNKTIYCGVYSIFFFSFLVISYDNSTNPEPEEPAVVFESTAFFKNILGKGNGWGKLTSFTVANA